MVGRAGGDGDWRGARPGFAGGGQGWDGGQVAGGWDGQGWQGPPPPYNGPPPPNMACGYPTFREQVLFDAFGPMGEDICGIRGGDMVNFLSTKVLSMVSIDRKSVV